MSREDRTTCVEQMFGKRKKIRIKSKCLSVNAQKIIINDKNHNNHSFEENSHCFPISNIEMALKNSATNEGDSAILCHRKRHNVSSIHKIEHRCFCSKLVNSEDTCAEGLHYVEREEHDSCKRCDVCGGCEIPKKLDKRIVTDSESQVPDFNKNLGLDNLDNKSCFDKADLFAHVKTCDSIQNVCHFKRSIESNKFKNPLEINNDSFSLRNLCGCSYKELDFKKRFENKIGNSVKEDLVVGNSCNCSCHADPTVLNNLENYSIENSYDCKSRVDVESVYDLSCCCCHVYKKCESSDNKPELSSDIITVVNLACDQLSCPSNKETCKKQKEDQIRECCQPANMSSNSIRQVSAACSSEVLFRPSSTFSCHPKKRKRNLIFVRSCKSINHKEKMSLFKRLCFLMKPPPPKRHRKKNKNKFSLPPNRSHYANPDIKGRVSVFSQTDKYQCSCHKIFYPETDSKDRCIDHCTGKVINQQFSNTVLHDLVDQVHELPSEGTCSVAKPDKMCCKCSVSIKHQKSDSKEDNGSQIEMVTRNYSVQTGTERKIINRDKDYACNCSFKNQKVELVTAYEENEFEMKNVKENEVAVCNCYSKKQKLRKLDEENEFKKKNVKENEVTECNCYSNKQNVKKLDSVYDENIPGKSNISSYDCRSCNRCLTDQRVKRCRTHEDNAPEKEYMTGNQDRKENNSPCNCRLTNQKIDKFDSENIKHCRCLHQHKKFPNYSNKQSNRLTHSVNQVSYVSNKIY